ncbi:MAG: bifunctional pyr operon transcriptional regulator/uracil phosphoribosyltransferase PyrR [Saprospiraceae bacterium]|nr:bifunctional pyr operon transcriptional regulator/uracil phosphoribosyltransferase PyrR [Saprospiraceae bacterium]
MMSGRIILAGKGFELTIDRLCYQLIENYDTFEDVCLIGIQERGALLSDRLMSRLKKINKNKIPQYGKLDITFYRDDYRQKEKPLKAASTEINFLVEDKRVILVDDVLYTGRTVHAAISAIQDFGRPSLLELLCLVDRRFNRHLPIAPDYTGVAVDALDDAYVKVAWGLEGNDVITMYSGQNEII